MGIINFGHKLRQFVMAAVLLQAGLTKASDDHTFEKITASFRRYHESGQCYARGNCHNNVYRFLRDVSASNLNVVILYSSALVLNESTGRIVLRPQPGQLIYPLHGRVKCSDDSESSRVKWGFHVFLENKGQILDFDYKDKVDSVDDYFEKMYLTSTDKLEQYAKLNRMYVRSTIIPAVDYVSHMNNSKPFLDKLAHYIDSDAYTQFDNMDDLIHALKTQNWAGIARSKL